MNINNSKKPNYNLCIVQPQLSATSETFLDMQAKCLPANVTVVHGWEPHIGNAPVLSPSLFCRGLRKIHRVVKKRPWEWEITSAFLKAFRKTRADAVLAQYGPTGVRMLDACRLSGVPLIVHFHGYDASRKDVITVHLEKYQALFEHAAAIVSVSQHMTAALVSLGAPSDKIYWSPCGVNCEYFDGANPSKAPPLFVAVGRFTEKKAPHVTLLSFEKVLQKCPEARLRMIGDGSLLASCKDLTKALRIQEAVTFLGPQPPRVVRDEMRKARCFVQHSVEADSGDCEGTPVGIIEAGASGLPVVSTRHAGIPDVVIEGTTGLLVDEHDIDEMARCMVEIATKPDLAGKLGQAAHARVRDQFSMNHHIDRLWAIIASCIPAEASCSTNWITPTPLHTVK